MTITELLDKEGFDKVCWNECQYYTACKEPHGEITAECTCEDDDKCPRLD